MASVLVLVGVAVAALGAVAVARQRAASVADLAALAAAARVLDGQAVACARAARVAERGGGRLTGCVVAGDQVLVTAQVRPPGPLGDLGPATARARAGPGR